MRAFGTSAVARLGLVAAFALMPGIAAWAQTPIRIGLIASLSGPIGAQGQQYANGAKLAAKAINEAGGIAAIGKRPLDLSALDDASVPANARTLAIKLMNDGDMPALLGPWGSGTCLAVAPVAEQQRIPIICSGTADQITQQGYRYVFNRGTLASTFVGGAFTVLKGLNNEAGANIKKVSVLYEDGAYGTNGDKQAKKSAAETGFELTSEISFRTGTPDLSPLVNRAVGSATDAILAINFLGDTINIVRGVKTLKSPALVVGYGPNVIDPEMQKLGATAEGVLAISDWNDDVAKPGIKAFRDAYRAAHGTDAGPAAAAGWSDTYFLKEALEKAGTLDPTKVRDAIASVKLSSGPALDVEPYNQYGFDENGLAVGQNERLIAVQVQDGKFVTIWPPAVASGKFRPTMAK
ncbi:ABC transporter substrate-binding protein [Bosea sp. (in: a-proteobacteria)]|uniref:ABC transporter substrate-binding protein n=1 Tax=Bosea sp. (in: a-proteobacteria) TaxID=1871050 RepID=UPI0026178CAA|nr:ABC transporter substrate-binding protein [Bosea sp. (in: a-proteobacteria)]MCO5091219.1 ABC transporter substrate-binding protein [Bosea sp. (in: a-proteobacteria)]